MAAKVFRSIAVIARTPRAARRTKQSSAPLDLAALTLGKQRELPFNFRFYQNFDQEIAIPAGFKPEHLAVEVHSSRKDVAPLVQTILWNPEPAP